MADNLLPSSADVTESGSLKFPELSGPHRPVMEYFTLQMTDLFIYSLGDRPAVVQLNN
jgi:hypothetical protein